MAQDEAGERSEQASARKQEEARKKGQVARSKELVTASLIIGGAGGLLMFGQNIARSIIEIALQSFQLKPAWLENPNTMYLSLASAIEIAGLALLPFLVFMFALGVLSSIAIGGLSLSSEQLMPKWERLSPFKGFKRMFGLQSVVELVKSIGKFIAVGLITFIVLRAYSDDFLELGRHDVTGTVEHAADLLSHAFMLISLSLIVIVLLDVPYQIWHFARELRMTKEELREEFKETEGKPEVKGRIRRLQREIAQRRMMSKVPIADVVITNPQHYAVALKYDPLSPRAPMVLARGADLIALQIRRVAEANGVYVLEAPPLARALYHTTELEREIPQGLYLAVAQVLAYVYSLRQYGRANTKPLPTVFPIPEDMKY
jgi:flagellar biosynthetic protein FlhB